MNLESFLAVAAGLGITVIYALMFARTVDFSRRLGPTSVGALALIGYLARLLVVAALFAAVMFWGRLDTFVTAISFMVSFTLVFAYTQARAIRSLMTGRLSDRKE